MTNNKDLNPFEMVLDISDIAKENEWKDKQNVEEEEQTIKKIINRPVKIKNYPYDAYKQFLANNQDDDLS
ncbi:hypothetical protein AAGG74_14730 [Bacillus mexicanus]|uniref:hypothetical protein n=1 Tax=Bacillus mexicanus TaxID=2834415 RepID=UPI003D1E1EAB